MRFRKYHGLGNDYLIPTDAGDAAPDAIDAALVRAVCAPHTGFGSDGILYGPYLPGSPFFGRLAQPEAVAAFRILNPDGSEAEKSGNGVRIFAQYLYDCGMVKKGVPFTLATLGGPIRCRIETPFDAIVAEMGQVSFDSRAIPVAGPPRDVLHEHFEDGGTPLEYCCATIGNPHCVVLLDTPPTREFACQHGPDLETAPRFPNRTNVQFAQRLGPHDLRIEIWERGAGYTLASGTSASAAAAVAVRIGWCASPVAVHMPGGDLAVAIDDQFRITITGPVRPVYNAETIS